MGGRGVEAGGAGAGTEGLGGEGRGFASIIAIIPNTETLNTLIPLI